ncbi:hypothetical protein QBC38DRAFT_485017 [Podospora fimiseda]|uniref:N-acetyltransferase domain-containing protein n=1 Tax=Podospora fimiseda TaxID=252190 RepID=A0AAN7GQJ3_9PEZI|nr:hypothetical protein QBC38DRAFT_485017 [Podospora fimiseda]
MSFRIRDAVPSESNDDAKFTVSAFDSCIPHLSSIGSAAQWGTTPLSTVRPEFITRHVKAITDGENYRLTGEGAPIRVLIAEVELPPTDDSPGRLRVGSATLRAGYFPQYVLDQPHLREATSSAAKEEKGFMYLDILVTDFSEATRPYRRGAGAALLQYAKNWVGKELGMQVMYVDCWAGNEGKLVSFYEAQGFERVDGFVVEKPDNEEKWSGMLLRMDLRKEQT